MRVFVAGASGAIGQPLIAGLIRQGHTVTGMTQSEAGAQKLIKQGAAAEIANAFDASAVKLALQRSESEVVIDQLTALPKKPSDLTAALPGDLKLRIEGGGNLHQAALDCGIRLYIQQGSGFFLKAGTGLADESEQLAINASPNVSAYAKMYTQLEARTLDPQPMKGIVLRYVFFTDQTLGTTKRVAPQMRFDNSNFHSSDKGKVYGLSFILRTQPLRQLLPSQPNLVSTTS